MLFYYNEHFFFDKAKWKDSKSKITKKKNIYIFYIVDNYNIVTNKKMFTYIYI